MKNRIEDKFQELRRLGKKAFIAFITAGDPNLNTTKRLVLEFSDCAVDIVELGVPFSDPLADGPIIQAASNRALKQGINLAKILYLVSEIRKYSSIPIALMSYYNPIYRFGEERFIKSAKKCGVDGLIIPDLPPEEAQNLISLAKKQGIATIFFLSPTSSLDRIRLISKVSTGFIYYVSLTGTTGIRENLAKDVLDNLRLIKKHTQKAVCVGFGVSNRKQIKTVSRIADGVIVGSAIVKKIQENINRKAIVRKVTNFVKSLAKP